jgi:lysophospholipid acyltransferase (LPLAT)-like uncharacterized protein
MRRVIDTVPRRFSWRQLLLEPVFLLTNLFFFTWFWIAKRTCNVRVTVPPVSSDERLLLYCWHKHAWIVFGTLSRLQLPESAWVCHDGFLSMMAQRTGLWSGAQVVRFALRDPTRPSAQIVNAMRANSLHLGIATDSGGPYGKVKPGLISMARELDARLVPIAMHVARVPRLGKVMRHELPVPFMGVTVEVGAPLPKNADLAQAQDALELLEAEVAQAVEGRKASAARSAARAADDNL